MDIALLVSTLLIVILAFKGVSTMVLGNNNNGTEDDKTNTNQEITPSKTGGWGAAIFILFVEVAERFAFYGLSGNLITYLRNELKEATPNAAKSVNTWAGVSSFFPVVGAYVADSLLGRFNTILLASIIYCLGMILLALSVSVVPLDHRKAIFFLALYIASIGGGGHKPNVQTFAADQFGEESLKEKKAKSSFFNWWFLGIEAGASVSIFTITYIQDNVGWAVGFGMLAGAIAVALVLFLMGMKRYRKQGPLGSPYSGVAQVFIAAARKWKLNEIRDGWGVYYGDAIPHRNIVLVGGHPKFKTLARTNQLRYLDKAMVMDNLDVSSQTKDPWRLCSQNQVEEVKLVIRLIPIWFCCIMFPAVRSLLNTYFTTQGSTMIRSIGSNFNLPPASLQSVVGLTVLVTIPIYDRVFVPKIRKFTGHHSGITVLQRIGIGLFLSIILMVVSALVEMKRLNVAKQYKFVDNPKAIVPMRIWWLLPQYVLCGLCDAFAIVGLQELFYDQMPEIMRSLGAAAYVTVAGVGNFVTSGIISAVQEISTKHGGNWLHDNLNQSHLDYFYWVMAGLSALNLFVYLFVAKNYVYKKVEAEEITGEESYIYFDGEKEV